MNPPIILFDGLCNLCNSMVNFIIRYDKKKEFKFVALQSESAKIILSKIEFKNDLCTTVVLLSEHKIFSQSDAIIKIFQLLGLPLSLLSVTKILPRKYRDSIYDFISSNRYRWFGKRDSCMMPTKEIQNLFL